MLLTLCKKEHCEKSCNFQSQWELDGSTLHIGDIIMPFIPLGGV